MRAVRLAVPLCAILLAPCRAADDAAETACHNRDTTVSIMDCLDGLAARWDARLNKAYQIQIKASESDARRSALVQAERAWVRYRDANCGWYDAEEGTIREIDGAQCLLDTTRARATELEASEPR